MALKTRSLKVQDIEVKDATQRTITVVGGKGTGKTTLIKMFLDQEYSVLVLDPLNVIKGKGIDAYRIPIRKEDNEKKLENITKLTNKLLQSKKNVVLYFNEMLKDEMVEKVDYIFPRLNFRDGYVFIDEIHEFTPHFSGSQEVHRAIRHWRNKNIGFVMSTQRPASVDTNVIGMTDYLILFRITWKNDIEAVKEILKHQVSSKEEMDKILRNVQTHGFMEGYVVDFMGMTKN
jgi:DNA helicase HerA-like ATPase